MQLSTALLVAAVLVSLTKAAPPLGKNEALEANIVNTIEAGNDYHGFGLHERVTVPEWRNIYPEERNQHLASENYFDIINSHGHISESERRFILFSLAMDINTDAKMADFMEASTNIKSQRRVSSKVLGCITLVAKKGIQEVFPSCKPYLNEAIEFCKSLNGITLHAKVCHSMLLRISMVTDQCNVVMQENIWTPMSDSCMALIPQRKNSKADQLISQVSDASNTPGQAFFNISCSKQSKTKQLTLGMCKPAACRGIKSSIEARSAPQNIPNIQKKNSLKVITIPIGQGDCTLIYCPNGIDAIVFDCGSTRGNPLSTEDITDYFGCIDNVTILISHGHDDHCSQLPKVFDAAKNPELVKKVKKVIFGGPISDYTNNAIKIWLNKVKKLGKPIESFNDSRKIHKYNFCGDADFPFEIVAGDGNIKQGNKNERGIVMKLSCLSCNSSLLFAGDMEGKAAKNMATNFKDFLNSTHYKMAHHGASSIANKKDWLKAISPSEVHVSHMYNGTYGHPRCDAIERLMNLKTMGTTKESSHPFTCNCNKKSVIDLDTRCRFYSTAPRKDVICTIELSFTANQVATTNNYCCKIEGNICSDDESKEDD